jgi:hypothetical protein
MTITLNGTTGITNDGGYTGDGVVFADTTPANTLVTDTSGNVGIGTSSPGAKLDVVGASRAYSRVANGGPSNTAGNNIWWYIGTIRLGDSESATLRMDGTQSYGAGAGIAGCTYLHLRGDNANGLSGYFYGTTSGEFTVTSIAYKATATSEQFDLWVRIAEFGSAVVYCDTIGIYVPAATGTGSSTQPSGSTLLTSVWSVTTGGVERWRIDSSGNLLQQTAGVSLRIKSASTDFDISGQPGATDFLRINANGAQRYQFNSAGQAYNTTGTWGTISDVRLKDNITDATPKLTGLMQLRVVNYNLKSDPDVKQLGFIAQEVEQVFPGLVEGLEEDGEGGHYKAVKTTVLVPMLIKAIQEQQAIITALTARVEALEGTQP